MSNNLYHTNCGCAHGMQCAAVGPLREPPLELSAYENPLTDDELSELSLLILCERNGFDALDGYDHSQLARAIFELLRQRGITATRNRFDRLAQCEAQKQKANPKAGQEGE